MDEAEYDRMRREYHATLRVLALIVEKFLDHVEGETIELDETAVLNAPDLDAFLDTERGVIGLRVNR